MDVNKQIIENGWSTRIEQGLSMYTLLTSLELRLAQKKNQRVAYRYTPCLCLEARIENLITYKGTNVL
jgi:hypothetical protein